MAVVSTGFFDGVHLGHRLVIGTLVREARRRGEESVVVTFWPHPRNVLQDDARNLRLLSSLEEKKLMLRSLGVDRIEVVPFTRDFAAMTAEQYLRDVLISRFGATAAVIGYDNRLGSDHQTFSSLLPIAASLGLELIPCVELTQPEDVCSNKPMATLGHIRGRGPKTASYLPQANDADGFGRDGAACCGGFMEQTSAGAVSSTMIRKALQEGRVEDAALMLGYRYGLHGVVVAGNRLGRTIGFPTANMQLYEPLKLIPAGGVYAVEVETLGRKYLGMSNIGTRPTVGNGCALTVETNIFDFGEDIYGLDITIRFLRKIRDEKRFPSMEALRMQLAEDRRLILEGASSEELSKQ